MLPVHFTLPLFEAPDRRWRSQGFFRPNDVGPDLRVSQGLQHRDQHLVVPIQDEKGISIIPTGSNMANGPLLPDRQDPVGHGPAGAADNSVLQVVIKLASCF